MYTKITQLFNRGSDLPLPEIMAAVIFLSIIVFCIVALFNRKEGNREQFVKSILIITVAAFIMTCSNSIAKNINSIVSTQVIDDVGSSSTKNKNMDKLDKEMGFGERMLCSILSYCSDAVELVRDFLVGQNLGIRKNLRNACANTLVSQNVTYEGYHINLYNLILTTFSFLLLFMIVNTVYKLTKYAYNSNEREEVIKSFMKWGYVILLFMITPGVFITSLKVLEKVMDVFNAINADCTLSMSSLTVEEYGPLSPVAKIYSCYIEFKVYVLMIYRKFIINAFYITLPIPIYLYGVSDKFDSMTTWTNIILVNTFSPIAYSLTFILATLVLKSIPNGNNPINIIIVTSMALTIGDQLRKAIMIKGMGQVMGGSSEVNSISRTVFSVAMIAKTAKSIMSKQNAVNNASNKANNLINNQSNNQASQNTSSAASSQINTATHNTFSRSSENSTRLRMNYPAGQRIKDSMKDLNTNGSNIKTGAKIIAGVATGIATGNPIVGYAAYKATGATIATIGSTGKNAFNGVQEKINSAKKWNADRKAYRRD